MTRMERAVTLCGVATVAIMILVGICVTRLPERQESESNSATATSRVSPHSLVPSREDTIVKKLLIAPQNTPAEVGFDDDFIKSLESGDKEEISRYVKFGKSLNVIYRTIKRPDPADEQSPLDIAIRKFSGSKEYDFVLFLLENGATVASVHDFYMQDAELPTMKVLIRLGLKPKPIWLCTWDNETIDYLVTHNYYNEQTINEKCFFWTNDVLNPLEYAVLFKSWKNAELLKAHGAKLSPARNVGQ